MPIDWRKRWASASDDELRSWITTAGEGKHAARHRGYAEAILSHITPHTTLDIGGGTGELGKHLPGSYAVLDHPRMERFVWEEAIFLPLGTPIGSYDLVVNTNSFVEMDLETVKAYFQQISKCNHIYVVGRKKKNLKFADLPLESWEPLIDRHYLGNADWREYLGRNKELE